MGSLFFSSIATIEFNNQMFIYSIFGLSEKGVKTIEFSMYPTFLIGLTATIFLNTIYCISAYKHRMNQMKFVMLNTLLILFFIVLYVLAYEKTFELIATYTSLVDTTTSKTSYLFGSITPILSLIFNILAYRGIKKDELLVRSADRIR